MRKRGLLNKKTGKMEWFDEKGERCRAPRNKLKPGDQLSQIAGRHGWPMFCEASGCHVSQIAQFEKMMADAGCPTRFPRGRAEYRDNSHRTKALKIRGIIDKDACYSQPTNT